MRLDAEISDTILKDVVTNAADPSGPAGHPSLLGNQLLNHFNIVFDNLRGEICLTPNGSSSTVVQKEGIRTKKNPVKKITGRRFYFSACFSLWFPGAWFPRRKGHPARPPGFRRIPLIHS